jgi:Transposase IS4
MLRLNLPPVEKAGNQFNSINLLDFQPKINIPQILFLDA